jgi:hypothetical protein
VSESTPQNARNQTSDTRETAADVSPNGSADGSIETAPPRDTETATQPQSDSDTLYCVNHPNVETLLRCNRCGRPICLKCAELTDVGYRCKECIRGVQDKYFTALPTDNIIAFGVALLVTAVVAPVLGLVLRMFWLFGWILAFMLGGAAGGILAQIIRSAVGKRRGRYTRYYALGGVILGVIAGSLVGSAIFGVSPIVLLFNIPLLIFAFLVAVTTNRLLR